MPLDDLRFQDCWRSQEVRATLEESQRDLEPIGECCGWRRRAREAAHG